MSNASSPAMGDRGSHEPVLKLSLLSQVDIFRDLSEEEIEEIGGMVNMVTYRKEYIFYSPEEQAEVLFLLKKGKVQVYTLTAEGKRLVIDTIGPGTFFGEMPLTAQRMHRTFAEAAEDSVICVLSQGDLERLLLQKPRIALRLLEALGRRLEDTQSKLEETTFQNATARVCRTLLRLGRGGLELAVTHQELADSTGLYRETVTNVLNRLQSQELVELGKKKIVIVDRGGLEKMAET